MSVGPAQDLITQLAIGRFYLYSMLRSSLNSSRTLSKLPPATIDRLSANALQTSTEHERECIKTESDLSHCQSDFATITRNGLRDLRCIVKTEVQRSMELRRSAYDYDLVTNRTLRSEPNNLTMSSSITFIDIDTMRYFNLLPKIPSN